MTLSTQPFSNLRTSSLNFSTSRQQSSGRRSFSRRHRTTSLRAVSIDSGTSLISFLVSSRVRSSSISRETSCRDVAVFSGIDSAASFSVRDRSRASSSAWSLCSSAATRACIWASASWARDLSVYCVSPPIRQYIYRPLSLSDRRREEAGDGVIETRN